MHPAGGEVPDLVAVDLVEELIRLATRTGATVTIIHTAVPVEDTGEWVIPQAGTPPPRSDAATVLDSYGGIGALLRFTITPD